MEAQASTVDESAPPERFYRRDEACEVLGISLSTLQRAIRSGEVRIRRTRGGIVWIAQSEIDKYNRHHPIWTQPPLDGVDELVIETAAQPVSEWLPMSDEDIDVAVRTREQLRGVHQHDERE
jgi:excisionase family DNA binding protein